MQFEFRLNNKIQIRLSQHYYRNMHERKQIGFVNWKSNWILYILCCLSAVLTFEVTHDSMLHRADLSMLLFSILAIRTHLVKVWMHVHQIIISREIRYIKHLLLFKITIFIFISILGIWLVNKCINFLCISKVKTKVTYSYLRFENDRQNGKVRKCFAFSYRQPSDILWIVVKRLFVSVLSQNWWGSFVI